MTDTVVEEMMVVVAQGYNKDGEAVEHDSYSYICTPENNLREYVNNYVLPNLRNKAQTNQANPLTPNSSVKFVVKSFTQADITTIE